MATPSPAEAARRWSANTRGATESYKAGIQAVTSSPMEKAAAKADQYAAGVAQAVADGRYQDGLRKVSLQSWQQAALGKGAARMASGVQAAEPKMLGFLSELLPYVSQTKSMIDQMPNATEADRDARMMANVTRMRQFRRTGSTPTYR